MLVTEVVAEGVNPAGKVEDEPRKTKLCVAGP